MPYIHLNFDNNYGLYFFVFFLIPLLFFYKTEIINTVDKFFLSRNCTTQIKGLFILVVVLHHISQSLNPGLMDAFRPVGYLAVGAFFFVSGLGLVKSVKRNNKYLEGFLYKKVSRIYVPFLFVNLLTVIALSLKGDHLSFADMVKYTLSFSLIDKSLWFIVAILIFYCLFWLSFYYLRDLLALVAVTMFVSLYVVVCLVTGQGPHVYISSFSFPLGIIYGYYDERVNTVIFHRYYLVLMLTAILFTITYLLFRNDVSFGIPSLSCSFFTILILVIFLKIQPGSEIFELIGNISLEIYLLHMKFLALFSLVTGLDSGVWIAAYLFVLILSSWMFSRFNQLIYGQIVAWMGTSSSGDAG